MRIILAHNNYSVQGGAEVFFYEVGRILETNGHTVTYFSAKEEGSDNDYFPEPANYKTGNIITRACHIPGAIYNIKARNAMKRLIADFKPDIIHAFAIYVRLTPAILDPAREAGIPVVLSCNDYKHICPNYKLFHHGNICEECKGGKFYHALVNRCCHNSIAISAVSMAEAYVHDHLDIWRKNVACFLFASRFMANKTEEFWGKGSIAIDYLRNPFDEAKHHIDVNIGKYILYFGRLIDEKGVHILLEAAALAPEVPIVIVGDGPDRSQLEVQAQSLPNVRMVGPAWGDALATWLRDARAVVIPSLWHENFPYVIMQAFAAGKPVIGSTRGGIPELINAGPHGWLYDAKNVVALTELLRTVQTLPDTKLADMGTAAQKYVTTEFTDEKIYHQLIKIYGRVLN